MHKKREITDIRSLLSTIVKDKNWQQRLKMFDLFEFWNEAVGESVAGQARPYVIRGTVLWVNVTDSVWMQQLQLQKNDLINVINSRLADEKITDIRFRLDRDPTTKEISVTKSPEPMKLKQVDKKMLREFENMISSIESDEVRTSMKNLWIKLHQLRPAEK